MAKLRNVNFKKRNASKADEPQKGYFHEWVKLFDFPEVGSYNLYALVEDIEGNMHHVTRLDLTFTGVATDPDSDRLAQQVKSKRMKVRSITN